MSEQMCERCGDAIEAGEERQHLGRLLCEDCYMDALSPTRACDPWAVYTAKSLMTQDGAGPQLNTLQRKILDVIKETGGIEPPVLCERLQVKSTVLDREIATLRHMDKIRGELRDGKRYILLS